MSETKTPLKKKDFFKNKHIYQVYKMIRRYGLREQAYKKLLQFFIEFQKSKLDTGDPQK